MIVLLLGVSSRIHQGNQEILLLLMKGVKRLTKGILDRSSPFRRL